MDLSYISTNVEELMDKASPEIKELITNGDADQAAAILGKSYKIQISSYVALSNIIVFILLGALKPEDVVRAIKDLLEMPEEDAYKLAQDLDKTILEKARIRIFKKTPDDMVTLTFQEGRSPDELRKEILDTTKREPVSATPEQPAATMPLATLIPKPKAQVGSRSQLMEQLEIIGSIPNDEEVAERLRKIQEQVMQIQEKEASRREKPSEEHPQIQIASPELKSATYSKAPTKYNVDPYREVSE